MVEKEKGNVVLGTAPQPRKKVVTIITTQTVVDHLKTVAGLYDEEFIAGSTKHRTILEKLCKLFTPEDMLELMKNKMYANRKTGLK